MNPLLTKGGPPAPSTPFPYRPQSSRVAWPWPGDTFYWPSVELPREPVYGKTFCK